MTIVAIRPARITRTNRAARYRTCRRRMRKRRADVTAAIAIIRILRQIHFAAVGEVVIAVSEVRLASTMTAPIHRALNVRDGG